MTISARSRSTTLIAATVLTVATVGLIFSGAGLIVSLVAKGAGGTADLVLTINSVLSTTSKLGLIATGLALLFQHRRISAVASIGLVISLVDSFYYFFAIYPQVVATKSQPEALGVALGAVFAPIISVVLYVAIFLYVRSPRRRGEFAPDVSPTSMASMEYGMARKIGFGLVWFVVLYMGSAMLIGAIAAAIAGQVAGATAVRPIRGYLFFGALLIAVVGSAKGWLPGTKPKPIQSDSPPEAVDGGTARRRLGAWSAFLIFLGYVGAQLITGAFVGLVAGVCLALSGANLQDPATLERLMRTIEAPAAVLGMVVAGVVVVLLARYFARGALGDRSADGIAWARGTVADLTLGFSVGGLLSLGYVLVTSLLIPPAPDLALGPMARMAATPGTARTYWTVAVLAVAPPLEEFLFRGVLFSGLSRTWGRPAGAVLATALFVLLHIPETMVYWPSAIAITLLGVGALVLRIRVSAVGPAVAVHFAYNFVLVVVVYGF